jgi:ABC-type phosphate transport system ATPase subunit
MRISKLFIPFNITNQTRLKEINLTKKPLGSVIALVGKNGAGKSRVLKLVEGYFDYISSKELVQDHITMFPINFLTTSDEQNLFSAKLNFSLSISQNFPNPFNLSTTIRYNIPKNDFVKLIVFNALGKSIETLANEEQNAGTYEITFDASKYPSGVYFYRLQAGDYSKTKRMILIK